MAKTILVTGGTGLLGRKVLQAFEDKGWNAVGTGFSRSGTANIKRLDLSDFGSIPPLLDEVKYSSRSLYGNALDCELTLQVDKGQTS